MDTLSIPSTTFRDGSSLPLIGLGTYALQGTHGAQAVANALQTGYRLLDTAQQYNNESSVGEGIRWSGVPRDEVLVTTKIAGGNQGRDATRSSVDDSRRRLGLEVLDIVLIHWPNPSRGLALETWETMLELKQEGVIKHVGVSNFRPEQLQELYDATGEWPEINQIQLAIALPRDEAVAFHREHGIVTESWGPLGGRQKMLDQFAIRKVAEKHGVTPEQVALKWIVDREIVIIPKSKDPERQRANAALDFTMDADDLALLASLDLGEDAAADSRRHEEW